MKKQQRPGQLGVKLSALINVLYKNPNAKVRLPDGRQISAHVLLQKALAKVLVGQDFAFIRKVGNYIPEGKEQLTVPCGGGSVKINIIYDMAYARYSANTETVSANPKEKNITLECKTDQGGNGGKGDVFFARRQIIVRACLDKENKNIVSLADIQKITDIKRRKAIKIAHGENNSVEVTASFKAEASILQRVESKAVAKIRSGAAVPIITMPEKKGVTVSTFLKKHTGKMLPARDLLIYNMFLKMEELHALGLVHGDMKPDNMIYDEETQVFSLIDFGMTVKEKDIIDPRGTPQFSAPEVWACSILDSKERKMPAEKTQDLFSLGIILFQLYKGYSNEAWITFYLGIVYDFVCNEVEKKALLQKTTKELSNQNIIDLYNRFSSIPKNLSPEERALKILNMFSSSPVQSICLISQALSGYHSTWFWSYLQQNIRALLEKVEPIIDPPEIIDLIVGLIDPDPQKRMPVKAEEPKAEELEIEELEAEKLEVEKPSLIFLKAKAMAILEELSAVVDGQINKLAPAAEREPKPGFEANAEDDKNKALTLSEQHARTRKQLEENEKLNLASLELEYAAIEVAIKQRPGRSQEDETFKLYHLQKEYESLKIRLKNPLKQFSAKMVAYDKHRADLAALKEKIVIQKNRLHENQNPVDMGALTTFISEAQAIIAAQDIEEIKISKPFIETLSSQKRYKAILEEARQSLSAKQVDTISAGKSIRFSEVMSAFQNNPNALIVLPDKTKINAGLFLEKALTEALSGKPFLDKDNEPCSHIVYDDHIKLTFNNTTVTLFMDKRLFVRLSKQTELIPEEPADLIVAEPGLELDLNETFAGQLTIEMAGKNRQCLGKGFTGEVLAIPVPMKLKATFNKNKEATLSSVTDILGFGVEKVRKVHKRQKITSKTSEEKIKKTESIKREAEKLKQYAPHHAHKIRIAVDEQKNESFLTMRQENGEDLFDAIQAKKVLLAENKEEEQYKPSLLMINTLFSELIACHEQRIAHRDVKIENFLYNEAHQSVTLIDFGFAVNFEEGANQCGTFFAIPPEAYTSGVNAGTAEGDAFAAGMVLFTLYVKTNRKELYKAIIRDFIAQLTEEEKEHTLVQGILLSLNEPPSSSNAPPKMVYVLKQLHINYGEKFSASFPHLVEQHIKQSLGQAVNQQIDPVIKQLILGLTHVDPNQRMTVIDARKDLLTATATEISEVLLGVVQAEITKITDLDHSFEEKRLHQQLMLARLDANTEYRKIKAIIEASDSPEKARLSSELDDDYDLIIKALEEPQAKFEAKKTAYAEHRAHLEQLENRLKDQEQTVNEQKIAVLENSPKAGEILETETAHLSALIIDTQAALASQNIAPIKIACPLVKTLSTKEKYKTILQHPQTLKAPEDKQDSESPIQSTSFATAVCVSGSLVVGSVAGGFVGMLGGAAFGFIFGFGVGAIPGIIIGGLIGSFGVGMTVIKTAETAEELSAIKAAEKLRAAGRVSNLHKNNNSSRLFDKTNRANSADNEPVDKGNPSIIISDETGLKR